MTIWRMRIACWMPMATNTHSGCVMLIALPLQQWLHNAPQCHVISTLPALSHIMLPCSMVFLSVLVVRSRSDVTLYNINLQIISKV